MILRANLVYEFLLTVMVVTVLLMSSNMGLFYPTAEWQLASIGYLPQKIMQLFTFIFLFIFAFFYGIRVFFLLNVSAVGCVFVLILVISTLFSSDMFLTFRYIVSLLVISLPVLFYYRLYGAERLYFLAVKFLIFTVVANFLYIILLPQYGVMTGIHQGAWRGLFVHKNGFGVFFSLATILLYAEIFTKSVIKARLAFLMMVVSLVMMIMSKSSTAYIVIIIAFLTYYFVMLLITRKNNIEKIAFLILYIMILTIAGVLVDVYLADILAVFGKDVTLTGRTGLWEVLINIWLERPLFGYGLGYFSRPEVMYLYSVDFGWEAKTTHNSYLDILLGIGGVGLVVFLMLIIGNLWKTILCIGLDQDSHRNAAAVSGAFCVLFIGFSSSGVVLANDVLWVFLLIMLCLISSLNAKKVLAFR